MDYYVHLKENAQRFLDKLDKTVRVEVYKALVSLKVEPMRKGKCLGSLNSGVPFFEKRIFAGGGIRIYYAVLMGKVVVMELEYAGKVEVHRIGNKKSQKKNIAEVKKL